VREEEAVRPEQMEQIVEALLFSAGNSVALVHIAKTLGVDQRTAQTVIEQLAAEYDQKMRGIRIVRLGGSYQMTSRPPDGYAVGNAGDYRLQSTGDETGYRGYPGSAV